MISAYDQYWDQKKDTGNRCLSGVKDGTRTRDPQNHNLML